MTCPATGQVDAAPTSLPLMVRNRQPDTETGDPKVAARLIDWFGRARAFIGGYTPADNGHLPDPDTSLSRTQLLSLVIGFTGCDTIEGRGQRTYTLIHPTITPARPTSPDKNSRT